METLKKRSSFLYVREGAKWISPTLVLQARVRPGQPTDEESGNICLPRFGFTASKKVGNAVQRNRAKRRLREAVRHLTFDKGMKPARNTYDYVLIARLDTLRLGFDEILKDMSIAFERVHGRGKRRSRKR